MYYCWTFIVFFFSIALMPSSYSMNSDSYEVDTQGKDLNNQKNLREKLEKILTNKYNDSSILNKGTTDIRNRMIKPWTLLNWALDKTAGPAYDLANSLLKNTLFSQNSKNNTLNVILFDHNQQYFQENRDEIMKVLASHGAKVTNSMLSGKKSDYEKIKKNLDKDTPLFFSSTGEAKPEDDPSVQFFISKSPIKIDATIINGMMTNLARAFSDLAL